METQLAEMRVDYRRDELDVGDLAGHLARAADPLAGRGHRGRGRGAERDGAGHGERARACPRSRTVLCKDIDERGVVFYTNYTSGEEPRPAGHPARRR